MFIELKKNPENLDMKKKYCELKNQIRKQSEAVKRNYFHEYIS